MDISTVLTFLFFLCIQSLVYCDEVHNNNGTDRFVSYKGFGDLVLACNRSDVINITGVNLTNHKTSCQHKTCTLSENDKVFIENCNEYSTCTIPVHNMSVCITETGFYNVRYSCKMNALICDFDNNKCQIQENNGGWKINKAVKAGTGYRDLTKYSENGGLMYIINGQSGETKISNQVHSSPKQCLSFWYWGINLGYLSVYREHRDGSIDTVDQFPNANNTWKRFMMNLSDIGDYYLRFKATGSSGSSKFLIDDITILNGDCDESTDRVQYNQTCSKVDAVTELHGCSKYYIENVSSHLDPLTESCYSLLNEKARHICNNSSDPVHCDVRQLVNRHPSCLNLNTLLINYTCIEKAEVFIGEAEEMKNDPLNIGLVAGAASGALVVFLIFAVLFIICRRRRNAEHRQKKDPTQPSGGSGSGYLPSTQPDDGLSNNPLYGQSLVTTSKQSHSKPGNYPKVAEIYENSQNMYSLASSVNQTQDDDYGESVAGIYDISGNNRHKVNDPIYSYDHSVDDTYDTSYQGRRDNPGDDTYSHMFGKQTEDDYEIAGS